MIRYLAIRNLAVLEAVVVEFEPSFNVLTGETGAGKSILVEAVGLLLGGRASQELVRTGEELATVEAVFEHADGQEVVVRREITAQGRSRAFISGALATVGALRELTNRLVELHGQHEHQQLLDPEQHLPLLDRWAQVAELQREVADAYQAVHSARDQLDRLRMDSRERAARLELVDFQWHELSRAALVPGEDEELTTARQVLRSAETIRRLCGESYAELYDSDASVLAGLGHVWKRVGELAAIDSRFSPYLDQRDAIKAQLDDLAVMLRDFAASVDATPGRLEAVEDRLALLERLKRKHGPTLDDVIARREALVAEREALGGGGLTAADAEARLHAASRVFLDRAQQLSRARHDAAPGFARALARELEGLAMERARFDVRLSTHDDEGEWTERGIDTGEFHFSANPGEDLRPLARIVSGGELSRVMLALKTLAAADHPGKTLIFDEVDAGIGGRVASVVGDKLARLGERFQVLCITHLPQIAAAASTHFHIEKAVRGGRTATTVRRLDGDGRVTELARMLSGADTGQPAADAAEALLAARQAKAKGEPGAKAKGESPPRRKRK